MITKYIHLYRISKRNYALCILQCALLLLLSACGQTGEGDPDDPGFKEGVPTEVRITFSSRSAAHSRAGEDGSAEEDLNDPGKDKNPNAAVELIHDWWIAFVDRNGKVTILKRNDLEDSDKIQSTAGTVANPQGGFESETFKLILPSGTYDIYAFANITPPADAKKAIEDVLKSGELTGKYLSDFVSKEFVSNMQWPSNENIPMTGVMTKKISNTMEEAFSIEVVRAVAKVEFDFENPSDEDITLQSLKFGRITKSGVSLFPQYEAIDHHQAYLPFGSPSYGSLSFTFKDNEDKDIVLAKGNGKHNMYFYCKESLAPNEDETLDGVDYQKDSFRIDLSVKMGNETKDRTFYTKNILRYINRNDWIHIPIKFNDWIVIWKLHFYAPIGGYPNVFNQNGSGDNIEATVTTGGEFELYPFQIKKNNQEVDFYKDVDWDHEDMTVTVLNGSADLFITGKEPKVVANPGNSGSHPIDSQTFPKIVMGEFDPYKTGDAKVQIKFYLKESTSVDTEFTCTFTIHRQNTAP